MADSDTANSGAANSDAANSDDMAKLPFEDLRHFADSLWRNEEVGEKRFNYFVGLITAVAAGLVTLHTAKELSFTDDSRARITMLALGGLLLIGVVTYLRMLQRIKIKKEILETLKYIRETLVKHKQGPLGYVVPQKPADAARPDAGKKPGGMNWHRARQGVLGGGLAFFVGLIDAVLLGTLVFLWSEDVCVAVTAFGGALVLLSMGAVYAEGRTS